MGKKIMVVDDAMFMRKVICKNLQECGYTDIIEACDGEQACTVKGGLRNTWAVTSGCSSQFSYRIFCR